MGERRTLLCYEALAPRRQSNHDHAYLGLLGSNADSIGVARHPGELGVRPRAMTETLGSVVPAWFVPIRGCRRSSLDSRRRMGGGWIVADSTRIWGDMLEDGGWRSEVISCWSALKRTGSADASHG